MKAARIENGLRERREAIVAAHVAAENAHDVGAAVATFHHPRYEVNGEVSDGAAAVHELLDGLMTGFPDLHFELVELHHADGGAFGYGTLTGTHDGEFAGIPPTGRRIEVEMVGVFVFEEDRLVCEKVYYDGATVLRQVGVLEEPEPA